ncbi:MAG: hypothetical protein KTR31_23845 [Myxococcales bacterium]|nr:hypothetical protein [Myxococcales bacterium]
MDELSKYGRAVGLWWLLIAGCTGTPSPTGPSPTTPTPTSGTTGDTGTETVATADTGVEAVVVGFVEASSRLRVRRGESVEVEVTVERLDGYAGAVEVELTGLPSRVEAPSITIPAGEDTGTVTVDASINAVAGGPFEVVWRATPMKGGASEAPSVLWVAGAPGSLDLTFGVNGQVNQATTTPPDLQEGDADLAVDEEGRVLVVGRVGASTGPGYLLRLRNDGTRDADFGNDGLLLEFGANSAAQRVVVRPGSRPLVSSFVQGVKNQIVTLHAFEADGRLDKTYGTDGQVTVATLPFLLTRDLLSHAQGSYMVLNQGVYAVDGSGVLDPKFASSGLQFSSIGPGAVDTSGRLLVGASSAAFSFQIERRALDGTEDLTFGAKGLLSIPATRSFSWVLALAATSDGGGVALVDDGTPQLVRFDDAGQQDLTFGVGGAVELDGFWTLLHVQEDGKILVGGSVNSDGFLRRYEADGTLDKGFGPGGEVELGLFDDVALDHAAGRILVEVRSSFDIELVRLWQ